VFHCIKIANKFFENVVWFKYLEMTATNQNYIFEETESKLNSANTCYFSVWKNLFSCQTPWFRVLEKLMVCSCSQEIPRLFWNWRLRYCHVHKSLLHVPILSQMNPVHTLLIFPRFVVICTPIYSSVFQAVLPFRLSNNNFVLISHLLHACYDLTHLILLDSVRLLIFGEEYRFYLLVRFLQSPVISSLSV
jgi:hypothetical protein